MANDLDLGLGFRGGAALPAASPSVREARPLVVALDRTETALGTLAERLKELAEKLSPVIAQAGPTQERSSGTQASPPTLGTSHHVLRVMQQGDQVNHLAQMVRQLHDAIEV